MKKKLETVPFGPLASLGSPWFPLVLLCSLVFLFIDSFTLRGIPWFPLVALGFPSLAFGTPNLGPLDPRRGAKPSGIGSSMRLEFDPMLGFSQQVADQNQSRDWTAGI